jgi:hypothetical protein
VTKHYERSRVAIVIATVVLVTWVLSVSAGLWMLLRWLARHRAAPSPSSFPPRIIFFHLASASLGLAVWIAYLAADRPDTLAWAALGLLLVINGLGDTIMTRGWHARHRHDQGQPGSGAVVYLRAAGETLNGRRPATTAHALLAATTFFLVLLVALGVGS